MIDIERFNSNLKSFIDYGFRFDISVSDCDGYKEFKCTPVFQCVGSEITYSDSFVRWFGVCDPINIADRLSFDVFNSLIMGKK